MFYLEHLGVYKTSI